MTVIKLYAPITASLRDEYDRELEDHSEYLAARHTGKITKHIMDMYNELFEDEGSKGKGFLKHADEGSLLQRKVESAKLAVEVVDGLLMSVCTCKLAEFNIAKILLEDLKDEIEGHYSDGFGEVLEQKELRCSEGTLSIHLWKPKFKFTKEQILREWDVTFVRTGCAYILAETREEAMRKGSLLSEDEVSWTDDWGPTDAN